MNPAKPQSLTFTPPHCPNPNCQFHKVLSEKWSYRRRGSFTRKTKPYRVPRFSCLCCGRSFSSQTFSPTYWLKRPQLAAEVFKLSVGGMANRQIGRAVACAPATVDNLLARLGRHSLLFHRQLMQKVSPCRDIVIDGLVSFEHSQYFPFEHLLAVEKTTSFILHFTDAPLRRSGRMTAYQRRKRAVLEAQYGRPDPEAVYRGMREVLEVSLQGAAQAIVRSDRHQAYPRALRALDCTVTHRQISSRVRRDRQNELFEITSLEMFIRHSSANHRRETIAFSKRRQGSAERLAVFLVWKNYVKFRFEKGCCETPGMLRGVVDRVLEVEDVLRVRLFPGLVSLPARWEDYYWRRVQTAVLGVNRRHELKYAF